MLADILESARAHNPPSYIRTHTHTGRCADLCCCSRIIGNRDKGEAHDNLTFGQARYTAHLRFTLIFALVLGVRLRGWVGIERRRSSRDQELPVYNQVHTSYCTMVRWCTQDCSGYAAINVTNDDLLFGLVCKQSKSVHYINHLRHIRHNLQQLTWTLKMRDS